MLTDNHIERGDYVDHNVTVMQKDVGHSVPGWNLWFKRIVDLPEGEYTNMLNHKKTFKLNKAGHLHMDPKITIKLIPTIWWCKKIL